MSEAIRLYLELAFLNRISISLSLTRFIAKHTLFHFITYNPLDSSPPLKV
jgi:hypothetical protein